MMEISIVISVFNEEQEQASRLYGNIEPIFILICQKGLQVLKK